MADRPRQAKAVQAIYCPAVRALALMDLAADPPRLVFHFPVATVGRPLRVTAVQERGRWAGRVAIVQELKALPRLLQEFDFG